ncbi:uncharacterized protein [Antedon mediterranea]|uniref:uncharacterized protein n=1 Tax=Antedon mediterranea TaxID=105859 RepID=UPI003AF48CA0
MTRFRSILLLLAAICIVTSPRNISTRIQSDNTTCLLEMDDTDVLQELLKGDAVFINVKLLSFVDASDSVGTSFYENTTVIDVNHWVVAVGEIGELLLTFPFDFEFLSLGTLSPSVEHISLNVTSIPECFFELESDKDAKQEVCIERQLDNFNVWDLSLASAAYYSILQISTYFQCWQISDDGSVKLSKFMKHSLYKIFNWLSSIFALYFIWFLVSFLCHVKPMNENRKEYLSLQTDLPMGPKYFLIHSGNQYNCIFILRWLILWALVGLLQYIPDIIANLLDSNSFNRRRAALKVIPECMPQYLCCQKGIFINVPQIILCFLLLISCLARQVWVETHLINLSNLHKIRRSMDVRLILKIMKLPKNNYSGLHKLSFEMKEHMKLIVSISHWKNGLNWFRDCFTKINNKVIHITMLCILGGPFLIGYGIFTIFMSLPIVHIFLRFMLLHPVGMVNSCKVVTIYIVILMYGISMLSVLFANVKLITPHIFIIIWYFYIGLLVNPGTAGAVAAIILIVLGYVISIITDYYKEYVVLLQQVISAFDELIKNNMVQVSSEKLPSFPQFKNDGEDGEEHETIVSIILNLLMKRNHYFLKIWWLPQNNYIFSDQTSAPVQSDSTAAESAFNPQPIDTLSAGHTSVSVQSDSTAAESAFNAQPTDTLSAGHTSVSVRSDITAAQSAFNPQPTDTLSAGHTSISVQSDSTAAESAFNPQATDTLSAGHTSVSVQSDSTAAQSAFNPQPTDTLSAGHTSVSVQSDSTAAESAFNPQPIDTLSASHTSVSVQSDSTAAEYAEPSSDSTSKLLVIRQDTEGLTAIEKTFFDTIVTKYRPPETERLTIIMKLLILSLVMWVGFSTLKTIADYDELKQVKLYAAVAIAGIVPFFAVLLRNKSEEESNKIILEKRIRKDIKEYFKTRLSENWYEIMNSDGANDGSGEPRAPARVL